MATIIADFSQYDSYDLLEASKLLAQISEGYPKGFDNRGYLTLNLDLDTGFVFLVNGSDQKAMLNDDDQLEVWLTCPGCGLEGFKDVDMIHHIPTNEECIRFNQEIGILDQE